MSEALREKSREVFLVLIIIMIGVLIRMPIGAFSDINVTELNDPDSYYYARKAIEAFNSPVSEWNIFVNRADDPLMNVVYPETDYPMPILFSLLVAFICKLFKFLPINTVIYYFSSFLCPLSAIPAFIFVKKHTNLFGGMVAAIAMVVAPSYYQHTLFGFFDTDSIIMVMAIIYMLCHIETLLEENRKKQAVLACGALLSLALFSLFWMTYYYYAVIAVFLTVISFFFVKQKKRLMIPIFENLLGLFFCFVMSWNHLKNAFFDIIGITSADGWPAASEYITELERPVFAKLGVNYVFSVWPTGILNWIGGLPFFFAVLIPIFIFVVFRLKRINRVVLENNGFDKQVIFILLGWACLVSPLLPMGIRYVQLFALPLSIILGVFSGILFELSSEFKCSGIKKDIILLFVSIILAGALASVNVYLGLAGSVAILCVGILREKLSMKSFLILYLCAVFICPMASEYYRAKATVEEKFIPDEVAEAATYIADETPKDAMLVSWWGRGYYYQYATNRLTASDGGIYNGAYFYWLGNIFMTEDENLAKGICRMLQTGSLDAVKLARNKVDSDKAASELLKDILVLDGDSAKTKLMEDYGFSKSESDELVKHTHPRKPVNTYLLIDDHMLYNAEIIEYFGLWDFKNGYAPKVQFLESEDRYIFSKDVSNSILVRLYSNDLPAGFAEVLRNDGIIVFEIEGEVNRN